MYMLDLKSRVPIYEQLKNKTLELIVVGVLKEGNKMPSVRSLARELGVNPNTIQKAYQDMEKEGVIYSMTGKGSFVAKNENNGLQGAVVALKALEEATEKARLYRVSRENVIEIIEKVYAKKGGQE